VAKRYCYKNVNKRPVNIGGYRFEEGQELESDVLINGFNEAVGNGFLELIEREPKEADQDATQAPQTGNTGNVKVVFHLGVDVDGKEILKEVELEPNIPVEFPHISLKERDSFSWFKDAELTKLVNTEKAKAPKKGELHFYVKYTMAQKENRFENLNEPPNPNEGTGSAQMRD
jgi:hypothetical protein